MTISKVVQLWRNASPDRLFIWILLVGLSCLLFAAAFDWIARVK